MASKYIRIVRIDEPPEIEEEANEWFVKEHIPRVLAVPGILGAKRYVLVEGDGPRYMTVWEVESPESLQSELEKAGDTPWGNKLRPQFKNRTRGLYKQIYP